MITKQEYKKAWNKYNQENVLWRFDRWLAKINKRREENKKDQLNAK